MKLKIFPDWMRPAPDSAVAENIQRGKSPYTDAVHLLWSFWVFITPMFGGGYDLRWLVFTLASYPLFLCLFAMTVLSSRRASMPYALGMGVLCMALLPWYPSGMSYFVYACVMLRPSSLRTSRYLQVLLAMNAIFIGFAWWIGYPWQVLVSIPVTTLIIGVVINVEHIAQQQDAALKLSQDEIRRIAATAERERIGRDLHDLLGHTLSLITLKLELSRKLLDRDPDAVRQEIDEAEKVARHALAEVRSAVTGIRTTGIVAELAAARLMLEASQVHMQYEPPESTLPETVECALALVIRESVTNIARHAGASRAKIEFDISEDEAHLTISDNGRGGIHAAGNGLSGMRERVESLGGQLNIDSPRRQGTQLRIRVPLAQEPAWKLADEKSPAGGPEGEAVIGAAAGHAGSPS